MFKGARTPILNTLLLLTGAFGWMTFTILFRHSWGQDWMVFDTAARAYLRGDSALLLDGVKLTQVLNATHPTHTVPLKFRPWVYPPYTILLALPFGIGPWAWSYGGFMALSFTAMAAALRPWANSTRNFILILAGVLLCPASAYNIFAGQNGFLSAALLLAGIWQLEKRPYLAGALLALLTFKPQLTLLLPIALLAAGAWRAIAASCITFVLMLLISLVVPGIEIWRGFLQLYLTPGDAPRQWVELYGQSIYTYLHLAGASPSLANAGQAVGVLIGAACVWRVFRASSSPIHRLLVLLSAICFSAPHFGDYDAVLVAIVAMLALLPGITPIRPTATILACIAWCSTAINPPYLFHETIRALFPAAEFTPILLLALLLTLTFNHPTLKSPPT